MIIEITASNYRCFSDEQPMRIKLKPGSTAFIGANDSGKSSILRLVKDVTVPLIYVSGSLRSDHASYHEKIDLSGEVPASSAFRYRFNDRDTVLTLTAINGVGDKSGATLKLTYPRFQSNVVLAEVSIESKILRAGVVTNDERARIFGRNLWNMQRSVFLPAFRNAIQSQKDASYLGVPIGSNFIEEWDRWKNGFDIVTSRGAARLEGELASILGYRTLQINVDQDRDLRIIIDGEPFSLSDLGSGIAQLIFTGAWVGINRPYITLVDEPELNLHPALQVKFLSLLTQYTEHSVLFATHNIGLARSAADSIYSVRRGNQGSEVRQYAHDPNVAELMGEMSFSSHQDIGFDTLMLVEGPSELRAMQAILRLYQLDHRIMLLPLGGGALINGKPETRHQLLELRRICPRIVAVIDSERSSEGSSLEQNRIDFQGLCSEIDISCLILARTALENYFPQSAISVTFRESYVQLGPYESLKRRTSSKWSKSQNSQIAAQLTRADLETSDLGDFLHGLADGMIQSE